MARTPDACIGACEQRNNPRRPSLYTGAQHNRQPCPARASASSSGSGRNLQRAPHLQRHHHARARPALAPEVHGPTQGALQIPWEVGLGPHGPRQPPPRGNLAAPVGHGGEQLVEAPRQQRHQARVQRRRGRGRGGGGRGARGVQLHEGVAGQARGERTRVCASACVRPIAQCKARTGSSGLQRAAGPPPPHARGSQSMARTRTPRAARALFAHTHTSLPHPHPPTRAAPHAPAGSLRTRGTAPLRA